MKKLISLLLVLTVLFTSLVFASVTVTATQSKAYNFNRNYTLTGNPIDDIVAVANAQNGRTKADLGYTEAWCADFVSDCAELAGVGDLIPRDGYCGNLYNNIINAGGHEVNSPQKGDIIFYYCNATYCPKSGAPWVHVGIMTSSSSSIEGNSGGRVTSKSRITYTDMNGHTYGHSGTNSVSVKYVRPNYNPVIPPTNVWLGKNQMWYDIQDSIDLVPHADGANYYWLSVFKDEAHIINQAIYGAYSFSASQWGYGDYSAYITAANAAGGTDSEWVDFTVVKEPSYNRVYKSSNWYDITDTIGLTVESVCAKGHVIGIDKEGIGRVITEQCDSTFTIEASKLGIGNYSAYFSVYNGSGSIDTERISFSIVDGATYTNIYCSKEQYNINEIVTISVDTVCAKGQVIGIDKENVGRIITESCDNVYAIPASKLGIGHYSAYFSVYNGSGGTDTKRVSFEIKNVNDTPTEQAKLLGDANGDGSVGIEDATVIQRYLTSSSVSYPKETLMNADVDKDGELSIVDSTLIQRYIAKIKTSYPIGETIN